MASSTTQMRMFFLVVCHLQNYNFCYYQDKQYKARTYHVNHTTSWLIVDTMISLSLLLLVLVYYVVYVIYISKHRENYHFLPTSQLNSFNWNTTYILYMLHYICYINPCEMHQVNRLLRILQPWHGESLMAI